MDIAKNKTALITGASRGIGYEIAKLLAKDCSTLVLVSRSRYRLQEIQKELENDGPANVRIIVSDLAAPGAAEEVYRELTREALEIDILVNNAGFGAYGPFAETPIKEEMDMIGVNVATLTHLTGLLVPGMVRRKHGRILNVASTAAFQPGPFMAVYYASKAYVLSFSEALASELRGTGVSVTALCPGPTETGFFSSTEVKETRLYRFKSRASAADVALFGYKAMLRGRRVVVHGFLNKAGALLGRLSPRRLVTAAVRMLHERAEHAGRK